MTTAATPPSPPASAATSAESTIPAATAGAAPEAVADAGAEPAPVAAKGPCPDGMALVDRFCVDRWEAVLYAPGEEGQLTLLPHNKRPPEDVRFEARSMPGVLPQGYISRVEASYACKNAGKRLCSMREWRRACEGKRHTTFPYGQHHVAGRCNHEKPHLLSMKFGSDARRWKYDNFNDPSLDAEPGFLAKTGEYDTCTGPEGVYDLVGNLHEWVSDTVDSELVDHMDAEDIERHPQPWKEGNGVFMGGFFSTHDQHGPGCSFTTIAHEPRYHDYSVGFRCCAAADLPPLPKKTPKKRGK